MKYYKYMKWFWKFIGITTLASALSWIVGWKSADPDTSTIPNTRVASQVDSILSVEPIDVLFIHKTAFEKIPILNQETIAQSDITPQQLVVNIQAKITTKLTEILVKKRDEYRSKVHSGMNTYSDDRGMENIENSCRQIHQDLRGIYLQTLKVNDGEIFKKFLSTINDIPEPKDDWDDWHEKSWIALLESGLSKVFDWA